MDSHLPAEIAFDFQDQAADFALASSASPAKQLFDVRIHARRRLAGPDRAQDHDARVEASLRDREPLGSGAATGNRGVDASRRERAIGVRPLLGIRIRRQRPDACAGARR